MCSAMKSLMVKQPLSIKFREVEFVDALIRGFRDKARDDPRRQTKQQKELQDRQNKKADERNEINESIQEEKKRQRQTNKKQGRPQGSEGREHEGEGGSHFVEEPIRITVLDEREIREGS